MYERRIGCDAQHDLALGRNAARAAFVLPDSNRAVDSGGV